MNVESELQAALRVAMENHAPLMGAINGIYDERPVKATAPYLMVSESLVTDWGGKAFAGRDVRLSIIIHVDVRELARVGDLVTHVEDAIAAMPQQFPAGRIVMADMLRRRAGRNGPTGWAAIIDYRFRIELD